MIEENKVIIIGPSQETLNGLSSVLSKKGYLIEDTADQNQGLEKVRNTSAACIIADLDFPELDTRKYLHQLHQIAPSTPIIVLSSHIDVSKAVDTIQQGAHHVIQKPILLKEVALAVEEALSVYREKQSEQEIVPFITSQMNFEIPGALGQIESVIDHIAEETFHKNIITEKEDAAFRAALRCALSNAVIHGNQTDENKKVKVIFTLKQNSHCEIIITDEGSGFDPALYIDPKNLSAAAEKNQSGLLRIYCFMDEVSFNEQGNQIRMVKKRKA